MYPGSRHSQGGCRMKTRTASFGDLGRTPLAPLAKTTCACTPSELPALPGADVDIEDASGATPFQVAVDFSEVALVRYFVEVDGADVRAYNRVKGRRCT